MTKTLLRFALYALPLVAFAINFTEPRAAASAPIVTRDVVVQANPPYKVTIYKSERSLLANATRLSANSARLRNSRPTPQEVKSYVQNQAIERGVNPQLALWIVKHESSFNPRAKGDGEASRGLWQISKIYHPEVSDVTAYNVASSTRWSLERIREGKANEWSTYRFCRTLYEDCPF